MDLTTNYKMDTQIMFVAKHDFHFAAGNKNFIFPTRKRKGEEHKFQKQKVIFLKTQMTEISIFWMTFDGCCSEEEV